MSQKGFAPILIIIVVAAIALGGGYLFFASQNKSSKEIACTTDAMICPDGTSVGRTGPNCEFAKCPNPSQKTSQSSSAPAESTTSADTSSWRTYTNTTYKFQMKYPNGYQVTDKTSKNVCITTAESNCKLQVNFFELAKYKLIDNAGGYVFYFDVNKKEWLHDQTNQASNFVPKRIDRSLEAYSYQSGDGKCSVSYALIPTPSYRDLIEIINTSCYDDEGKPLLGANDFSNNQILSTFKFTDNVPAASCMPRPACLEATPRCMIPEPAEGWCP